MSDDYEKLPLDQRLGSQPIEPAYRDQMKAVMRAIDEFLNGTPEDRNGAPKKTGIVILMFPFGDGAGRCNYMSNASREDVIVLLKEQLAYFQGMPETRGAA